MESKVIQEGSYGCAFTPSLPCKKSKARSKAARIVGKIIRKENAEYTPEGRTLVNGYITKAVYNDLNLLETTSLDTAHKYIQENLSADIILIKSGNTEKFQTKQSSQTKFMDSEMMKKFDKDKLSSIINLRSFALQNIETAGDFIDKIDKDESANTEETKPELPL